jgi:hypothetical protein
MTPDKPTRTQTKTSPPANRYIRYIRPSRFSLSPFAAPPNHRRTEPPPFPLFPHPPVLISTFGFQLLAFPQPPISPVTFRMSHFLQ